MPLAPCQNNLWCIDRIDFKWGPTACPESLSTGIYFHYASWCVSNKSFPLLGPNIGDLSFSSRFLSYIFHNPEAHWWTRLEFSWHKIFDLDEGFLPIICVCMCEFVHLNLSMQCVFLCLHIKITQAIRGLSVHGRHCGVVTTDCTDRLIHNLSIFTGSDIQVEFTLMQGSWCRCHVFNFFSLCFYFLLSESWSSLGFSLLCFHTVRW